MAHNGVEAWWLTTPMNSTSFTSVSYLDPRTIGGAGLQFAVMLLRLHKFHFVEI